ncbi:conserved hypothetical protein [Trichinella spiralis]|uniref:hypothetical protein n=1 Tax=Trichinella spiralis TaxID=6334 RepID=UPI0001EFEEE8|nr:conserved hypothetical protein [Trichinella spiralis]
MARVNTHDTHQYQHFLERASRETCVDRKVGATVAAGEAAACATAELFWDQFEVSVDRQEDLVVITKILHLWSCLSGAVLKAIEGITVCAENYPEVVRTFHNRLHRVPEVVESHG